MVAYVTIDGLSLVWFLHGRVDFLQRGWMEYAPYWSMTSWPQTFWLPYSGQP